MSISYGIDELRFMSLLEQCSGVTPKDVIVESERITFLVPKGSLGQAIGRHGIVAKKLEQLLKRKVKIAEYSTDLQAFIHNLVFPIELSSLAEENGVVTLTAANHQSRGMLIGRAAAHLRSFEAIVKRHFSVKELKVE